MAIQVHHSPIDLKSAWSLYSWDASGYRDARGFAAAPYLNYELPSIEDARTLQFKYHTLDANNGPVWEPDAYNRRSRVAQPAQMWTFEQSARVLYEDPFPAGVAFNAGDKITVHLVTQQQFKGGRLHAWNPYVAGGQTVEFQEVSREDPVSTFTVTLAAWMIQGFHFVFAGPRLKNDWSCWEPQTANRFWRPCDGAEVWVKSGQVSLRKQPLVLTDLPIEMLYPVAAGPAPWLAVNDPVENFTEWVSPNIVPFAGSGAFSIAQYKAPIYPDAAYVLWAPASLEGNAQYLRPFPANPVAPLATSRFVLGLDGWLAQFPTYATSVTLSIQPDKNSNFGQGLDIQMAVGTGSSFATVAAAETGSVWSATLPVLQGVQNRVSLVPKAGPENKPYDWIDTRRFFTPPSQPATFYTAEGVFGLTRQGPTVFADPPNKAAIMSAAFGPKIAAANIFAANELPHGATINGSEVFFAVHAPHAVRATLILVEEGASGGPKRQQLPMQMTTDTRYWWISVPFARASAGTKYRYLLNDDCEVMDPAAKAVREGNNPAIDSFATKVGENPADPATSWSVVVDAEALRTVAWSVPWPTMSWDELLFYEIHPSRLTDQSLGALVGLEVLTDELKNPNRLGKPGYLTTLPATALQIMPVSEFQGTASWGYNPACFFAIDGFYGGASALADLTATAHAAGKAVFLDLVYNHMDDSPLTMIAPDVYSNGGTPWGPAINNGAPMVLEFFRQATVYLWRTFGLDGFRFDSTTTIVQNQGWSFLGALRDAVRKAASTEGRLWPYLVGENDPKYWDITNPAWSILDGEWDTTELYCLGDTIYDLGPPMPATIGLRRSSRTWMRLGGRSRRRRGMAKATIA